MMYKALVDIVPGEQLYKGDVFSEKDWTKAGGDKKDLALHIERGTLEIQREKKNVSAESTVHIDS